MSIEIDKMRLIIESIKTKTPQLYPNNAVSVEWISRLLPSPELVCYSWQTFDIHVIPIPFYSHFDKEITTTKLL